MNWDVIVVGAGAAGILAATHAAERGKRTLLLEKNRRPGAKILISGGARCNLTHATDARGIVDAFGRPGKFLHSALAALSPQDLVAMVEAEGVQTKTEPGGKVFPASDRARDVLNALVRRLQRSGCQLRTDAPVERIGHRDDGFQVVTPTEVFSGGKLILTTGGCSYPHCGTTGDGCRFARELGHTIVELRPALVPVTVDAAWAKGLQGVSVPDVSVELLARAAGAGESPVLARGRGPLLFTHFGLSGPVILDLSRLVSRHPDVTALRLVCDFLPDSAVLEVYDLLRGQASPRGRKRIVTTLSTILPRRLALELARLAGIPLDRSASEFRREEAASLVKAIKAQEIPVTGTLGFRKAEVTAGGVSLDEVDSRSLASKLVPGLHFAGELLDLDGPIGGYNFQAAFSTGWLAGGSV